MSGTEPLRINGKGFLQAKCPSCRPNTEGNLKHWLNQEKTSTALILSCSTKWLRRRGCRTSFNPAHQCQYVTCIRISFKPQCQQML